MSKGQHITRVYEWKTKHDYFLCWKKEDADDEEVVRKHQNVIWQMMIEDAEVEKKTNEETGEVEVLVLVEMRRRELPIEHEEGREEEGNESHEEVRSCLSIAGRPIDQRPAVRH